MGSYTGLLSVYSIDRAKNGLRSTPPTHRLKKKIKNNFGLVDFSNWRCI